MGATLILPLGGLLALGLLMAAAWFRQRRTGNAGIVDVIGSASLGLLAVVYAFGVEGWAPRRALVATLAGVWSLRLTLHLLRRVAGETEDGRHADLRRELGARFDVWMFWFFQAQAVLAVLLSLAFLPLMSAAERGWRGWDLVAVALWAASLGGEALADRQLHAWRAGSANGGKTRRSGPWASSRHPNHFFEWMHWLVYPVLGIGLAPAWASWALWLAPAVMLLLVPRVTGIPPTEAQSPRSCGEDYRAYQRTTNAFFPGPRKSDPAHLLETS